MPYVIKKLVEYRSDRTGRSLTLPALFTESGLLLSHLRFLVARYNKSPSWREKSVQAIKLLLEYINANQACFSTTTELLRSFFLSLSTGTIDTSGNDPSGLFWKPRRVENVNALLGHINAYCDHLDYLNGVEVPTISPFRKANSAEQRLLWCSYYRRQANLFLNHLSSPQSQPNMHVIREIQSYNPHMFATESSKRFPEEQLSPLLDLGLRFKRKVQDGSQIKVIDEPDYCAHFVVMLMHYGGLRLSECFHIYVEDVSIDTRDNSAIVSVFHPSDGFPPEKQFKNRAHYLNVKYGLLPRHLYPKSKTIHSGWKTPMLTSKNNSFTVLFFPHQAATLFLITLQKYLASGQRPSTPAHPYLFCNRRGAPETRKNFESKYDRALERIGLTPSKALGLSVHTQT
ncbi:gamma-mobile-trio recombinase GmtY [Pseudoalteromonas sp. 68 DY56-GL68]|uniref:gamma-mobile-trio recombinase GmtY n=1 Tax=Pseudoalteromonas sp. 68 DY56-GL68 TaxID=2974919 RepID=UPI00352A366F